MATTEEKPHLSTLQQIFTFSSRSRASATRASRSGSIDSEAPPTMVSAPWLPPVIAALPRHATYGAVPTLSLAGDDSDAHEHTWGSACHHYGMLVIRVGAVLVAVVLLLVGLYNWAHPVRAGCTVEVMFRNTCGAVQTEVAARVGGRKGWHDPHNNGTYHFVKRDAEHYQLQRLTGSGSIVRYTDIIDLHFESPAPPARGTTGSAARTAAGALKACRVLATSRSTTFSILDFSTNFCNINNLYSNAKECHPFTSLSYTYTVKACSESNVKKCYTTGTQAATAAQGKASAGQKR